MASIFSRIINKELQAYTVAENDQFIAFLDINPNAVGHTLCIPKKETDKLFDLEEEEYLALMQFSRQVALALEKAIPCKRIGLSVIGLEVPHVHVHLIPLQEMANATFQYKMQMSPEEFQQTAAAVSEAFKSL